MKKILALVLILFCAFVTVLGIYPHNLWHQTVYYSGVEGSNARVVINQYPPRMRWVEVQLIDFPKAGWDFSYDDFTRYDHRHVSSLLLDVFVSTGPEGILSGRINVPSCCVKPTLAGYMPFLTISYEVERGWFVHKNEPADWLR